MTESSDAGGSSASKIGTLRLASDIEINDFIDLSGKPCRVVDFYTKGGLCHFGAINMLTGNMVRSIVPPSTQFVIPDVSRDLYQLTGISYKDDTVTLLHRSGAYTRDDIFLPRNRNLRTMMVDGFNNGNSVVVGIVTSLGQDAVYAVDVYQAGTAITFDPNDDLLNQSKTNDSSNVVLVRNVGF
ncbi:Eukaryotic translation initiation factor 5A-3 [Raphanus sativus]|uniref:Eukaryotic translation initiation factor 5A-3-like n=1 Tax=Raphanus sativus TaxID=3726 RepID=A0A6J0NCR2_RAPSA|nr:eukaryotic translation initiation factor 5A-3-like [Raphanus sativus]KAJ4901300.1 Eukaryotic translation initiation factor 5A-3 [Raphanus sativus]